jgi:Mg2+ and Co2+ transporter CorA
MPKPGDDPIRSQAYIDARVQDLVSRHETDLRNMQDEVDRRIQSVRREMDLRFEDLISRMNRTEERSEEKFDEIDVSLSAIEGIQNKQRGRMAAYATISGIILLVLAITTLFLDHVHF